MNVKTADPKGPNFLWELRWPKRFMVGPNIQNVPRKKNKINNIWNRLMKKETLRFCLLWAANPVWLNACILIRTKLIKKVLTLSNMDICSAVHFLEGVGESYLYAFVIIFFINVFQITEIMKYIINQILITLIFS